MKKKILTFFAILAITRIVYSQNFEWAVRMGGTEYDSGESVTFDASGNIYITGFFSDTVDFDPGPGVYNLISKGFEDIFIQKLDSSGNFIWARQMGGTGVDRGLEVVVDVMGNIYTTGLFTDDTVDFDPGPGIYELISAGADDIFIQKLDSSGNFLWVKQIGGWIIDRGTSITIDTRQNIYVTGQFSSDTIDFDPGPGVYNMVAVSGDIFILKLDSAGNFIWVKQISNQIANSITTDGNGNVFITGTFGTTVDFDPGPDTIYLSSIGYDDIFVLKLDSMGNFVWAKQMGGTEQDAGNSITVDALGNVYVTGQFQDTVDFDPGTGIYNLISFEGLFPVPLTSAFIQKLDASGNFLWVKKIGVTPSGALASQTRGFSITLDDVSNVYTTGYFSGPVDFDPGVGIHEVVSSGIDIYIHKLDASGNYIWSVQMGNTGGNSGSAIIIDPIGNIHSTGGFQNKLDFNPGVDTFYLTSRGYIDIYVLKLSQDVCSNIQLSIDSTSDVSCAQLGYSAVSIQGAFPPYYFEWNSTPIIYDSIAHFGADGIYTLTFIDSNGCALERSVLINGPNSIGNFDLDANLVVSPFQSGFNSNIWINAFNDGCFPVSGTLTLILDSLVQYNTSTLPPDNASGDSINWNFNSITYDSLHISPEIEVAISSLASMGDTVCFQLLMMPLTGDADTTNNQKKYCYRIITSYDPNDKQVYPQWNDCHGGSILETQPLTYTIRFQNTGNAEAINIFILDSLNDHLDMNSVKVIGRSHPVITEVLPENVLKFRFDNIYLPDSVNNEPESHGYIIFEAYPKSNIPHGTEIKNNSYIYFDFNPAVETNTIINTVLKLLPECTTLTTTACDNYNFNGQLYSLSGLYDDTLVSSLGYDSVFLKLDLTIDATPASSVTQNENTLAASESDATYQWLNCTSDYAIIDGATHQSFTAAANGNYAVAITKNGCKDTSSCYSITSVGMNDLFSPFAFLQIYPNPFTSSTTIEFSLKQDSEVSLKIYDVPGRVVFEQPLSRMAKGIHHIQFENSASGKGLFIAEFTIDGVKIRKRLIQIENRKN